MKQKSKLLSFIGYCYIPVFIVCLILNCWLIYYEVYLKNNTIAFKVNYIDNASYAEDDTFLMEANIFNDVVEIKMNYYTDAKLPTQNADGTYDEKFIMSTGVQFYINGTKNVKDQIGYITTDGSSFTGKKVHSIKLKNCTFYTTPNEGQEYGDIAGGVSLANQDAWIWDVGGDLVCIKSIGEKWTHREIWTNNFDFLDMPRLIAENIDSFITLKEGVSIRMFDFSKYFTLFGLDDNGKFTKPMQDEKILREWTMVNVKVTKTSKNMIDSKQSIFNSYKGNTEWSQDGNEYKQEYWKDETIYNVTNKDFKFVQTDEGYNIQLKDSCIMYLKEFSNIVLNVDIDLSKFNNSINIIGFSNNPFDKLKVNKIHITADEPRDFNISSDEWQITTSNVNLVLVGGAE